MNEPAITQLIREVLAEELARLRRERAQRPGTALPGPREELVSIASDSDLRAFAARILKLAGDPSGRRDFEEGRLVFRFAGAGPPPEAAPQTGTTEAGARIERGFLSERQVDALPNGTKRLLVGEAVRVTPLARDRLRQRGIVMERTRS